MTTAGLEGDHSGKYSCLFNPFFSRLLSLIQHTTGWGGARQRIGSPCRTFVLYPAETSCCGAGGGGTIIWINSRHGAQKMRCDVDCMWNPPHQSQWMENFWASSSFPAVNQKSNEIFKCSPPLRWNQNSASSVQERTRTAIKASVSVCTAEWTRLSSDCTCNHAGLKGTW